MKNVNQDVMNVLSNPNESENGGVKQRKVGRWYRKRLRR